MCERTVVINGFSKSYSMTGWRVGYVAARREVIEAIIPVIYCVNICALAVSQWAALAAYAAPHDCLPPVQEEYNGRRPLWMSGLAAMDLSYGDVRGAYYILFDIRGTGLTSQQFSAIMRDEVGVGFGGGSPGDRYNGGMCAAHLPCPTHKSNKGWCAWPRWVQRLQAVRAG